MFVAGEIEQIALSLGIDACGVAPAQVLAEDAQYLREWTAASYHGSMAYMAQNIDLREDVRLLVPQAKTIVVCLFNYFKTEKQPQGTPIIAQCGLSQEDYHIVVKQKVKALEDALVRTHPHCVNADMQHIFCDSAPVLERRWAERAGLGWIGKNRLLIHPTLGSFVHIGILLLQEECEVSPPHGGTEGGLNRCGDCEQCLHACPTGAIRGDMFDARKCVSYLTIERKEQLEEKYKPIVAKSLYGCDRCQDVCPYNVHLQPTKHEGLQANPQLLTMTTTDWLNTSRRQKLKLLRRLSK